MTFPAFAYIFQRGIHSAENHIYILKVILLAVFVLGPFFAFRFFTGGPIKQMVLQMILPQILAAWLIFGGTLDFMIKK